MAPLLARPANVCHPESVKTSKPKVVENKVEPKNLFNRLGGTEGISLIVDDILEAHLRNPEIKHVFLPIANNPEKLEGFNTYALLPAMPELALYHPKTIEKQEKQNELYNKL